MIVVTSTYKDSYQNVLRAVLVHGWKLIVYNKNDNMKIGEEKVTYKDEHLTVIDIPNIGRCDYSFLYYIIKNYDNLPDQILFTKANYMDQNIQIELALNNKNFMLIGKHVKIGLLNKECKQQLLSSGISEYNIEELTVNKSNYTDPCFQSYLTNDFYKIVYGDKEFPDDYVVNFGHGPCFCVTREVILSHNIDIYEKLLDTFYPGKEHWTEWEGHSETETMYHIGKRYHDNLLRFWLLLFVQNYKNQNVITDYDNFVTMNTE